MKFALLIFTFVSAVAQCYGVSGGRDAVLGEFPWMVSLQIYRTSSFDGQFNACGGALISKSWVLTTAHCVKSNSEWNTIVEIDGGFVQMEDRARQKFTIDRIEYHPGFNMTESRTPSLNDIALVKLNKEAELDEYFQTVKLPEENAEVNNDQAFNFSGWSQISIEERTILQITSLPYFDYDVCYNKVVDYIESGKSEPLDESWDRIVLDADTTFCTGPENVSKQLLNVGDNGGPLVQDGVVYGLLSYILNAYLYHHNYYVPTGIFTNVAKYVPWIKGIVDDL